MCQAQQEQQMPLNAPPTSIPEDPLAGSLQSDAPDTVGVKTPTKFGRVLQVASAGAYDPTNGQDSGPKPTKFGALMKFIAPALQGGFIGLAGGKGHPQGGFGAANDFFAQKRNQELQQTILQKQLQDSAFKNALEAARTQHEINRPRFDRVPAAIKGVDKDGNPVIKTFDPETGEWNVQQDIFPADKGDHFTAVKGDDGEYSFNTTSGEANPIMVPDPKAKPGGTVPMPLGPRRVNTKDKYSGASASPQRQIPAKTQMIPLKPAAKQPTLTDSAADAVRAKHPNWTDDQVLQEISADKRKPDTNDNPLTGQKYNNARIKMQSRLDSQLKASEATRRKDLADLQKNYELTDEEKETKRQQIESDNADRKQTIHQQLVDEAGNQGINLGEVPDYQAELIASGDTGGPGPNANEAPAPAAKSTPKKAAPQTGQVRTVGGVPYKFNGKQWVKSTK